MKNWSIPDDLSLLYAQAQRSFRGFRTRGSCFKVPFQIRLIFLRSQSAGISATVRPAESTATHYHHQTILFMQITTGSVVVFDYTLTDDEGDIIDSSSGSEPLAYIQGEGQIVIGLEKAMEGRSAGDSFKVVVKAEEGYGKHDPESISVVPLDKIEDGEDLEEGMQLHTEGEFGEETVLITKIEGNQVTIDGNHPLAGITLHFEVTIREVRPATQEELEHGHVHGPGAHE